MPGDEVRLPAGRTLGARIKTARTQRGMTREATAALCGRSEEWLRQIEIEVQVQLRRQCHLDAVQLAHGLGQEEKLPPTGGRLRRIRGGRC